MTKNQNTNKLAGFSLVELLVAMAIIAILLGLVGFGIATAQRNSRDSQRRQITSDFKLAMENYLIQYNRYPAIADVVRTANGISLEDGTTVVQTIPTTGPATPAATTTAAGTQYCYSNNNGIYQFGADLEADADDSFSPSEIVTNNPAGVTTVSCTTLSSGGGAGSP